jgi:hydroxypyruvate isomerase
LKPVICFEMLFPDLNPVQKIRNIARQGFQFVEFWGWRDKDISALAATCEQEGVQVANFSGHRRGSLVAEQTHELFLEELEAAIDTARFLGCGTLMILSNELTESGEVADSYPRIPPELKYENVQRGIGKALEILPQDFQLVLEPLNTRIDHPGYWLSDMGTAVQIVNDIGDSRLKVLCDLYHLGVMGVDLRKVVQRHIESIGYIHIADVPGRHEPGTGKVDWRGILGELEGSQYDGFVGFEYSPQGDSVRSLRRIRSLWDASIGRP